MPRKSQDMRGLIIARLLLDVMKTSALIFMGSEMGASVSDEVLLCVAVYVGHVEGRPMAAAKLAGYIGMPRGTAVRKLAELKRRGLLDSDARNRWHIAATDPDIAARLNASFDAILPLVHKSAGKLSKLDTRTIANKS